MDPSRPTDERMHRRVGLELARGSQPTRVALNADGSATLSVERSFLGRRLPYMLRSLASLNRHPFSSIVLRYTVAIASSGAAFVVAFVFQQINNLADS
jgi:hypothetical protein